MTQAQFENTPEFREYKLAYEDYMADKSAIRLARLSAADKRLHARYENDAHYFLSPYRH